MEIPVRTFRVAGQDVVHIDARIPYGLVALEAGVIATPCCDTNADYHRGEALVYDDPRVDVVPNCIACIARSVRSRP